jgi:prepilin-type N-terminal cleavage/methylation domain-containing protein
VSGARFKRGFSLIEALVALIIAAIALTAVYELQLQLIRGQQHFQRALERAALQRDAMVLTQDINPTLEPSGAAPLGGGRSVRWRAAPVTPPARNTGSTAAGRRFEMRLYRLNVDILGADGEILGRLAYDRVGWRLLAKPAPAAPPIPPPAPPPTPPGALPGPTQPVL